MKVYLDCASLTNTDVSGIGVYNKNLFKKLENNPHLECHPALKWSRFKKARVVEQHLGKKVKLLPPLILNKKALYHGTDHRLNAYSWGPRVVTIHDMQPFLRQWLDPKFAKNRIEIMSKVLRSDVQKIITVSEFSRQEIIRFFPNIEKKIEVVYHGYDLSDQVTINPQAQIKIDTILKGQPFLFFIGNIEERKNLINQIKAFEILKAKHKDLKFLIAGKPGFNFESIKKYIDESPFKGDIHLPGYLSTEEKQYAYSQTACLMFASFYEGFGIPAIEAMAVNAPVIISEKSALSEIAGGFARECNPYDIHSIAEVTEVVLNQGNLKKMSHEEIKSLFSWEKCAQETYLVYQKAF